MHLLAHPIQARRCAVIPYELDPPETTINIVTPDDWTGDTPRRLDSDQAPISRFRP